MLSSIKSASNCKFIILPFNTPPKLVVSISIELALCECELLAKSLALLQLSFKFQFESSEAKLLSIAPETLSALLSNSF
jgi:hypothetical protein